MIKAHTYGAIDIGSNAIRLLVTNVEELPHGADFQKMTFIRIPIRLGEDVFSGGKIGREKAGRLTEAMRGYRHIMNAYGVSDYRAYATSAMREASNGPKITAEIQRETGIRIEIISGIREAETIYSAGVSRSLDPHKGYLYVDVGGGSTEVVVYSDGKKQEERSFPLGTVRMLSGKVTPNELENLRKWLKKITKTYAPVAVIGSGGNINKVQRLLGKKDKESVSYTEMKVLYDYIKSFSYEDRVHVLKLNDYRADVIIPAMKIFQTVCKTAKIDEIIVPRLGLADGIVRELYELHK